MVESTSARPLASAGRAARRFNDRLNDRLNDRSIDQQVSVSRWPALPDRVLYAIYGIVFALALSIWFINIRAPLWLDETVSMYLIKGGLAGILSRHVWPDSPVYSCLLWLWTKAWGTAEVTLRISSLLPMLAAVYLLYRSARALFDRDIAILAAVIFSIHSIVIFAAIDIRPYAFAALAINATILVLVHLRHNQTVWLAALFGLLAAGIVQMQLLFTAILPALLLCFVVGKLHERRVLWRQLGAALVTFTVAFVPVIPRIRYMAHTSDTHVFSPPPSFFELVSTLTLHGVGLILLTALFLAAGTRSLGQVRRFDRWTVLLCVSLAVVPIFILYGLSVGTSIHVFVPRYRLAAIPGVALCWALLASWISSRTLRALLCATLTLAVAYMQFTTHRPHGYSWKYALQFMDTNAAADHAPVLMCSDIPEADFMKMPAGPAIEDSGILPPLTYYKFSATVVPLPRTLNQETMRAGSEFLQQATQHHERFLAAAYAKSYRTLDWLTATAAPGFVVHLLGSFDGVRVLEFVPRPPRDSGS